MPGASHNLSALIFNQKDSKPLKDIPLKPNNI